MQDNSRILLQAYNTWTYVLESDPLLLSVVDRECRYPTEHAELMAAQSYRLPEGEHPYGGWDGWIRLLKRPKASPPCFPTGLVPRVCRLARKFRYQPYVDDRRMRPDEEMPEFPAVGLRPYQQAAVKAALEAGRGVLDLPPRAGKTRIGAELQRRLGYPTVWLAPTERIVAQTADVLEGHFGAHYVHALDRASDAAWLRDRRIVVMTAAMAARLPAEWYQPRQVILVDEFHHCLGAATPIWTANGSRLIVAVEVGDLVMSWGENGLGFRRVMRVWRRPSPESMLRVHTEGAVLDVTREHWVYTPVGQVQAQDLRVGGTVWVHQARKIACGRIVKIEPILPPTREVYDLEVEGNHNYFAAGVLVSNSAAKTYTRDIWPKVDHIFYRYGMTGTFFRSGDDAMAMHALLSQTVYRMTPGELLEQGYLVPTHCVFLPVDAPRLRGAGKGWHQGFGSAGVHEHEIRSRMAADAALSLVRLGRRVLVLVGTKRQGYALQGLIQGGLPCPAPGAELKSVEFLSTDRPKPIRQRVIESFLEGAEVRVLVGTSLLGEGVDLPSADALVYARGERAEVSLIQQAYRVGTSLPGKRAAVLVDFADRHHKRLMAHSVERLRLYFREPTFSVTVLDHASQLESWASQIP
jgi:superfamily II DNA or RNA helicase